MLELMNPKERIADRIQSFRHHQKLQLLLQEFCPNSQRTVPPTTDIKCTSSSGVTESLSRLYKQLNKLNELQNMGTLTATDEYKKEKDSITAAEVITVYSGVRLAYTILS